MNVKRSHQARLPWGRRQLSFGARRSSRAGDHGHIVATGGGESSVSFGGASRTRRHGGPPQDRALYACGCGHVFDALVSTSVDCPACGDTQAW